MYVYIIYRLANFLIFGQQLQLRKKMSGYITHLIFLLKTVIFHFQPIENNTVNVIVK